jgi:hypothetical protein
LSTSPKGKFCSYTQSFFSWLAKSSGILTNQRLTPKINGSFFLPPNSHYSMVLRQPTAVLLPNKDFLQEFSSKGFVFSDLDAFFEVLPIWQKEDNWTNDLFSIPISGINQNLANTKNMLVGLFGEKLLDKKISNSIISKYNDIGYHVLFVDKDGNKKFFVSKPQNSVKIKLI